MGYTTEFEGSIQVKRRKLIFNLQFTEQSEEDNNDLKPITKHSLENIDYNLFEKILLFAFHNESSSKLHFIRLISKNLYFLCNKINQNRLFSKVDFQTVSLINGLSESRRMIRYRYINGIDYGIDGQYFIDTNDFGQNYSKYNTFYDGLPIDSNQPPRTQPGLWMQWIFNEKKQCIEWNGGEKFYNYIHWLVYLINNILHPKYILFGEIKWEGGGYGDIGVIKIKNDGKNIIKTIPKDKWSENMTKSKKKDIIYNDSFAWIDLSDDIIRIINDKKWIENNKTIKTFNDLKEAVTNSKKRKLKTKTNLNNEPPKKKMKRGFGGPYCKYGCGKTCNAGFTARGNPFDTCCKSCAISKGSTLVHDNNCNQRND